MTREGLLVKGLVEGGTPAQYSEIVKKRGNTVFYNKEKNCLETFPAIARAIAKKSGMEAYIIKEYPIWKPWEFERTPIKLKK